MTPRLVSTSKAFLTKAAISLAVLASVGFTTMAPARADWDGWRHDDWRRREWREHEWREREWREHHAWRWSGYTYYAPNYDSSFYYGR